MQKEIWRKMVGRPSYRGGGRRGGGPFRGGGRGNFGPPNPRSGGSGPPFRGRGRGRGHGRGGSKRFPSHGASTSSQLGPPTAEDGGSTEEEDESAPAVGEETPQEAVSELASGKAASNKRPPQAVWCELCRVDCTSMEILEQHKNGKRHKKNLQRLEESKNANKPIAEAQTEQNPLADSKPEVTLQPDNNQESEETNQTLPEGLPAEADSKEVQTETEQQNDTAEQAEIPQEQLSDSQVKKPWVDQSDSWRRGMKRKMRGGRGGKRMRTFDAPRRPMEPPKPKVVIPLICDLCNVKCDTQEIFDRHLAGKKHISKLKRFEGHQAMYGPMGLKALYPPNPIAQALFLPQGPPQALYGPQASFPPPGAYMPPQAHQAALPPAAGSDARFQQNAQFQQNPMPQGLETYVYGSQTATTMVPEAQWQPVAADAEAKQAVIVKTNPVNGISEPQITGFNPPVDNGGGAEHAIPVAPESAAPATGYGATVDHFNLPVLDMQAKEGAAE